jgi:hypothetical protein
MVLGKTLGSNKRKQRDYRENYSMRIFIICTFHQTQLESQLKVMNVWAYRMQRKSEGKRPLKKPWRRWEVDVKIDFKVTELEGVGWINLPRDGALRRNLVNILMFLGFCRGREISCPAELPKEPVPLSYKAFWLRRSRMHVQWDIYICFLVYLTMISQLRRLLGDE